MFVILFRQFFHDHGIVSRTGRRRKPQTQGRGVFFVHLNHAELFEHPHPRLHLVGFGICPFKTFDKFCIVSNKLLLFIELFLLLLPAFFAQLQIGGIVDAVVVNAAHGHLNGAGGDVVNKGFVVRNNNDGLGTVD